MTVVIAESQIRGPTRDRDCRGSLSRPDAPTPYIEDEMRVVDQLKADGVMTTAYRRTAGPGVYALLEGSSDDAIGERVDTLRSRSRPDTVRRSAQQLPVAARAHRAPSP